MTKPKLTKAQREAEKYAEKIGRNGSQSIALEAFLAGWAAKERDAVRAVRKLPIRSGMSDDFVKLEDVLDAIRGKKGNR